MPKEMVEALKPDYIIPLALCLGHESTPVSGGIFEAGGGWFAQATWQRSPGLLLDTEGGEVTAENLAKGWEQVTAIDKDLMPDQMGVRDGANNGNSKSQAVMNKNVERAMSKL